MVSFLLLNIFLVTNLLNQSSTVAQGHLLDHDALMSAGSLATIECEELNLNGLALNSLNSGEVTTRSLGTVLTEVEELEVVTNNPAVTLLLSLLDTDSQSLVSTNLYATRP